METYGKLLNIAVPVFLILFIAEWLVDRWKGKRVIRHMDSISSLSSGMTNVVKDILGLSISIITYGWLVRKVAIVQVENTFLTYAVGFLVIDFHGYWSHRWSHEINFLWNRHIIHHSSEEFNLACALRQSISGFINFFTILLLPAALLGVPTMVIAVIGPLHLFLQYWYHTRLIGKMGFLEKIIVTPSHHRVHHAINPEYLDKNLSQIFIFWDKLFGTFQEELDDAPPVYCVTRPVRTWNPVIINFQHLWLLIQDAWRTRSWAAKFKIWFMPTGWRPSDVAENYPVFGIKDVYHFDKYDPKLSSALQWWSWIQFAFTFASMMYLFNRLGAIGFPGALVYGGFLVLSIFSYSMLMDKNPHAWWVETLKSILGLVFIYLQGDWFLLQTILPGGSWAVAAYFLLSALVSVFFVVYEVQPSVQNTEAKASILG